VRVDFLIDDKLFFSLQSIERSGHPRLPATTLGESPEVLFIHGCMQTVAMWRDLIQALGNAGMGSAAVDLRGHGNSDSCEALQDAGIEDYAADAKSVQVHMPTYPANVDLKC
jgi:pimeloyl-ACP methyl ester carboxylesterase